MWGEKNTLQDKDSSNRLTDSKHSQNHLFNQFTTLGNYEDYCNRLNDKIKMMRTIVISQNIMKDSIIKLRIPHEIVNEVASWDR